jgi:hypothetical protein
MSLTDEQNSNKPTRDSALAAALGSYKIADATLEGLAYAAEPFKGERQSTSSADIAEVQEIMAALADIDAQPTDVQLELSRTRADLIKSLTSGQRTIDPRSVKEIIEKAKDLVEEARIRAADAAAERQAEMQKLWGEISKLSEAAGKRFDDLPTSQEEKDKRKALEDKVKEADKNGDKDAMLKAQLELLQYYEDMGIKYDDPKLVQLAIDAIKKAEVLEAMRKFEKESRNIARTRESEGDDQKKSAYHKPETDNKKSPETSIPVLRGVEQSSEGATNVALPKKPRADSIDLS